MSECVFTPMYTPVVCDRETDHISVTINSTVPTKCEINNHFKKLEFKS